MTAYDTSKVKCHTRSGDWETNPLTEMKFNMCPILDHICCCCDGTCGWFELKL